MNDTHIRKVKDINTTKEEMFVTNSMLCYTSKTQVKFFNLQL